MQLGFFFFFWFLLNYTDFAHKISHIKPSKYDSIISGTNIQMFEKKLGDEAVDRNKHLEEYNQHDQPREVWTVEIEFKWINEYEWSLWLLTTHKQP